MTVPPRATLMKPARDSTPVVLGPNLPTLVVGISTHGYEYNPAVQRIRNEWEGEAVFGRFEELQSSALTLQRDSSRWAAIFFDMTYHISYRCTLWPRLRSCEEAEHHRRAEREQKSGGYKPTDISSPYY